ncbi:MAG TPA: hypothetical protein VGF40_12045, partial [Thermoanaerobaculia bacterium]
MPRALRTCLVWLALYAALAWGLAFVIERRMVDRQQALFGGLFGALMVMLALGWLIEIFTKPLRSLTSVRLGINGEEPVDGEMYAACGPIDYAGLDTMVSPITRTPAVAYTYRIGTWPDRRAWQGVGLAACRIQCGNYPIRLLALPRIDLDEELRTGEDAKRNAEAWVKQTSFSGEPGRMFGDIRLPDTVLADGNGAVQWNVGQGNPDALGKAMLHECVVAPGDVVCAIGRYSTARGGLVVDTGARGYSIVLRKDKPQSFGAAIVGSAGNLVKAAIALGIAAAGLLALQTFIPLGLVEIERPDFRPSWLEVRVDDFIEANLRGKIVQAGFFPDIEMQPGRALALGEAHGRVKSAKGEAEIVRAELRRVEETFDVLFFDAQATLVGAIKVSKRGELLRALVLGEEVDFRN